MMRVLLAAGVLWLVTWPAVTVAGTSPNPAHLLKEDCMGCHGTDVFSRSTRQVSSLAGLKARVRNCTAAADADWTSAEVRAVVDYLNRHYYDF